MAKRYGDPRLFLLGSVPTLDDKKILTSKLPTNKQVLFSFIIRKEEEYSKNKTKKSIFSAAMGTVLEEVLPIYAKARIPTKTEKNVALAIIQYYEKMQELMKIKKDKRGFGKGKERIEEFKKSLEDTMVCWPKDALAKITNAQDKEFLLSMQKDRIGSIAGRDMITHKKEAKQIERKEAQQKRRVTEEKRINENSAAILLDSSDNQASSADESSSITTRSHKRLKKTGNQKVYIKNTKMKYFRAVSFIAGETLFVPHNILKSPEVVSCAIRNKISTTALSAVTKAFIGGCDGDITKFNLEYSQSHR